MKGVTEPFDFPAADREFAYQTGADVSVRSWISAIRRYIAFLALASLIWEFAHLPLYTIWLTGTPGHLAFAALHCTGGDVLIGLSTLMGALVLVGPIRWPSEGRSVVLVTTVLFGLGYTVFSEWLNLEVRQAWAYRSQMPVIPFFNTGLSPMLQWLVIPVAASFWAWRRKPNDVKPRGPADA